MKGLQNYLFTVVAAILALGGNLLLANSLTVKNSQHQLHTIFQSADIEEYINLVPRVADTEDANLTVPELIQKYNYPSEIHKIVTEDGYILEAHRIPYGIRCGEAPGKKVVWLQHGLMGDSSNWVISGVDRGLAYVLADRCFDVWMGNFRGNTYSKNHTLFDLNDKNDKEKFWAFSWHEMGMFDLKASIDYALTETGASSLFYVGHSMGTTSMWVLLSERPEYNSKITLMSALAPVAYMKNMRSLIRVLELFMDDLTQLIDFLGMYEIFPSTLFLEKLGLTLCKENAPTQAICSNILFLIGGYNTDQMDLELLPVILGHSPAGSSARSIIHYGQGISTGEFRKYDFGNETSNNEVYGAPIPPEYDISKITAPVAFYWAENDLLADKIDVLNLAKKMPNLQRNYRINHNNFTHLDFIWAIDQQELVNQPVIEFMMYVENPTVAPPQDSGVEGRHTSLILLLVLSVTLAFITKNYN